MYMYLIGLTVIALSDNTDLACLGTIFHHLLSVTTDILFRVVQPTIITSYIIACTNYFLCLHLYCKFLETLQWVLKQSQHKRKKFTYLYFHEGGTSIYLTYHYTSLFYDSFLRDSEGNSHGLPVVGIIFSLT